MRDRQYATADFVPLIVEDSDWVFGTICLLVSEDGRKAILLSLDSLWVIGPCWDGLIVVLVSPGRQKAMNVFDANPDSDESEVRVPMGVESRGNLPGGKICRVFLDFYHWGHSWYCFQSIVWCRRSIFLGVGQTCASLRLLELPMARFLADQETHVLAP
jgi:hypothetical protein